MTEIKKSTLLIVAALVAAALPGRPSHADGDGSQPPYSWRGINGSGVFPAADLVTEFWDIPDDFDINQKNFQSARGYNKEYLKDAKPGTRKNVVWRSDLPSWGNNSPVVMGNQVYVMCEPSEGYNAPSLLCFSAVDGKQLWQQPVDHLEAWPAEKQADAKRVRAIEIKRWADFMRWWNKFYWNNETATWVKHDEATWKKLQEQGRAAGWAWPDYDKTERQREGRVMMRHRYGLGDGETRARPTDPAVLDNFERSGKERIYWREGWTSEGPWYGVTFGSVVGDGLRVYAVTAMGAAAAFDTTGRKLWVTDLHAAPHVWLGPHMKWFTMQLAAPVIADSTLVYWHADMRTMYGLDPATGKLRWETVTPGFDPAWRYPANAPKNTEVRGYSGHMGPNGTPVVMRLPSADKSGVGTTVAVTAHGMVVRVSDGKTLGQVRFVAEGMKEEGKEASEYSSTYNSWVASGDILYAQHAAGFIQATRLSCAGDELKQERVWTTASAEAKPVVRMDFRDNNLAVVGDFLRGGTWQGYVNGGRWISIGALNLRDGTLDARRGPRSGGYSTAFGYVSDLAVMRTGNWTAGSFLTGAGPQEPGCSFETVALAELKTAGVGFLAGPKPTAAQKDKYIAQTGAPGWNWGVSAPLPWGNRIFIRSNDYLWCIGDPSQPYVAPEDVLKKQKP